MDSSHDEFRERQHELFKDYPPAWHAAIDAGHDMTLVAEALRQTPAERLHKLQAATNRNRRLRDAADHGRAAHN